MQAVVSASPENSVDRVESNIDGTDTTPVSLTLTQKNKTGTATEQDDEADERDDAADAHDVDSAVEADELEENEAPSDALHTAVAGNLLENGNEPEPSSTSLAISIDNSSEPHSPALETNDAASPTTPVPPTPRVNQSLDVLSTDMSARAASPSSSRQSELERRSSRRRSTVDVRESQL